MTRRSRLSKTIAMMGAMLLSSSALAQTTVGKADIVFVNGKVITVDPAERIATSVAVQGNRIVAVGNDAATATWRGPETQIIDLKGKPMLPGFIDGHSHVAGMAAVESLLINIQVPPLKDASAIVKTLQDHAAKLPKGAWLVGQGTYNQVMPTRAQLDAAFPDNPVDLQWGVHDHLINHRAATVMGLTKDFPDPTGVGRYERTANGEVMIIRDAPAPWPKRPELTEAQLKEGVRTILSDFYMKKGVTTVYDHVDGATARAYQDLRDEGRLPTRVRLSYFVRGEKEVDAMLKTGLRTGMGDDWIKLGSLKIPLDGVWGTTAAVYKPFWKGSGTTWVEGNVGGVTIGQEELNREVIAAHRAGWQIQTHANGDRAQDMILTAYEAAQKLYPRPDARDRIEHFGHFLVQDPQRTQERLNRMVRDKVIPSPQVAFLWRLTDVNLREPDMTFFALRTMIDRGMHPIGGVDTVGTQNFATPPIFSISRAVNRDTKYGAVVQPEEAITPMEGIKMFTIWAAEGGFLEKDRGSIEVGKLADLIVLSDDPLTASHKALPKIDVTMTMIDGKIAYQSAVNVN